MKIAVIYYSYEGNSAMVADLIKTAARADVYEIKTVNEKKRTGFAKYFWGGCQVVLKKRPALKPLSVDLNAYELIILGTPVWAGSPAPALVSFLSERRITGKKIALYCCYNGGKGQVFEKLKALLPGNTIVAGMEFMKPATENPAELRQKIEAWVKTIGA